MCNFELFKTIIFVPYMSCLLLTVSRWTSKRVASSWQVASVVPRVQGWQVVTKCFTQGVDPVFERASVQAHQEFGGPAEQR